jgi:NodT family efflux transporter outer membrane factor (OMF) lipoprotein
MTTLSARFSRPARAVMAWLLPWLAPLLLAWLLAWLLAGCGPLVRTPYTPPEVTMPAGWSREPGSPDWAPLPASAPVGAAPAWTRRFGDPELDRLVAEVLRRNNDLAAATIKVYRARLKAGLAADALQPALGAEAGAEYERSLSSPRTTSRFFGLTGTVGYEVDLWGKLGTLRDAAAWEALATDQDRESTALSLIGTTMDLYWLVASLNERLDLSRQSIAYAAKTLDLVRTRRLAGADTALEVNEAEQGLADQQASREDLLRQRVEARNALAILFGGPPGDVAAAPVRLPEGELPPVDAGLPAELLGRRPDLRAAELRLREYLADVDATRVSYYPSLTLTGSLGTSSTALRDLLHNPVAALAGSLTLPFLQWNEMRLNVEVAGADYEAAVVAFRQVLYRALGEVENGLSARERYTAQAGLRARSLAAALAAERLYELRYRAGSATLQSWLDAQEKRRAAEAAVVENRLNRLTSAVALSLALGGDAVLAKEPDTPT